MGNSKSKNQNDVIPLLDGGFGNQLFMIANAYAYSLKYNKSLFVPETWKGLTQSRPAYWNSILKYFKDNKLLINIKGLKYSKYKENSLDFEQIPNQIKSVFLDGYFQSEKYFIEYEKEIRELFIIPKEIKDVATQKISLIKKDTNPCVAVHIRRGDYIKKSNFHHVQNITYYRLSQKYIEEKLNLRPTYLYFSDDKKWVQDNFKLQGNDTIVSSEKDYEEFAIMQQCDHFIIANSSFSWWAAWLGANVDKVVIAPKEWYGDKGPSSWNDIYAKNWVIINDYNGGYNEGDGKNLNVEHQFWRDDIILDENMKFNRDSLKDEDGIMFITNNKIKLLWNNYSIENITDDNIIIHNNFLQDYKDKQKIFIDKNLSSSCKDKSKFDLYCVNSNIINNSNLFNVVNFNVPHFQKYSKILSHLYLIQYAKENNLPFIIIIDNFESNINQNYISIFELLSKNLDKWYIFNGSSIENNKKISILKSFDNNFVNVSNIKNNSFMIYNKSCYDNILNYNFDIDFDKFISKNYLTTIYNRDNKLTINKYTNSIGIYGIFISKYTVFYKDFIQNIEENFYPGITKYYYIVTDDKNLPTYNNRTFFYNTERIGWPYETLYRFKYFLHFNLEDIELSDTIFFINSNGKFTQNITDSMIDDEYIFTRHHGYYNKNYKDIAYEKNNINSTAYLPYHKNKKYEYFAGGFHGAKTKNFISMCKTLNENIIIDEKNNYIALWHDESHINKFCYELNKKNISFTKLDIKYHIPEENQYKYKDKCLIYLDKKKYIKQDSSIKNLTNQTVTIGGKVIKNKYSEKNILVVNNYDNNSTRIVTLNNDKLYDLYLINLEQRNDRKNQFIKMLPKDIFNINHFKAIKHIIGSYGCALSHLCLIKYAKENNLPYIIIAEDDCLFKVSSYKIKELLNILVNNCDKWSVFNGSPSFWDKRNSLEELKVEKCFSDLILNVNWGQATSFMIYNSNVYDKLLSYNFEKQIDQFIAENFIQTIYSKEPFSIQYASYSDVGNNKCDSEYEKFFIEQYKIIKNKL